MTSRECVQRAITFQHPNRIPLGTMPPGYPTDICEVGVSRHPNWQPKVATDLQNEDEFGCIWTKLQRDMTMGQVTFHPLADMSRLKDYAFPDYKEPSRYDRAREAVQRNAGDKFVLGCVPLSLIHRLEYLRGHEAAWMDAYDHPDELRWLLSRLADIAIDAVDRLADSGVHGIMSCDDWGLQDRSMVSPDVFAEFWKPAYQRVYRHAHQRGLLTLLHSCGNIVDLLDSFIEAELDVIQMDQQENMGMDNLAERFGGRLCFWCPVDIQQTMIKGTVADVRAYARRLMDTFGDFSGGFMAQWYASPKAVQHAEDKIKAMCDEFVNYGQSFYSSR
jgi:uroporphyrinogen decarboxylase